MASPRRRTRSPRSSRSPYAPRSPRSVNGEHRYAAMWCPLQFSEILPIYIYCKGYTYTTYILGWNLARYILIYPDIYCNILYIYTVFGKHGGFYLIYDTRWCPPSYKLVISPMNYRYITNKNLSEIGVINAPTERYRTGAPSCMGWMSTLD